MARLFKVLLIEDDEDDYVLIREMLSMSIVSEFQLDWADTYDSGFEAIRGAEHDVVLLDYRLGPRNGLDLLRDAIALGCKMPIIILTGQGDFQIDMRAMRSGASDYLLKEQLRADLLERSIRYAVERKSAEIELRKHREHLEDLVLQRTSLLEKANRELEQEVIERKVAEVALRESEEKYRDLVQNSLDIVYTVLPDGTISSLNPAFETTTGWSADEWVGRKFSSLIHPEDLKRAEERFGTLLDGHTIAASEVRILTKSGKYKILELKTLPQVKNERITGVFGTARDVTDRVQAEEKMKEQKEFLANILESLSHPFYVLDADNYTVRMANSAAAPVGLPSDITCYELTHKVAAPCDGSEHLCPLKTIKETKQPLITEHIHYDSEGKAHNVEVHGYPIFDRNGDVSSIIEYALDITERKKIEEQLETARDELARERSLLHAILSQLPSGLIVAEPGGGIIIMNDTAAKILGHPDQQPAHLDEYNAFKFFRPNGRIMTPDEYPLRRALEKGETVIDEEVAIFLPNNGSKVILASSSPVLDPEGTIVAAVVTFQDVSDRKRAEEELHRRAQEYRALVENSPDIIMRVDREFRRTFGNKALEVTTGRPLSSFLGGTIYEPPTEERREYVKVMEKACIKVFSGMEEETIEFPYPTARGTRYFHMRLVPEYSRDGRVEGVLTISRDITELKQIQEELSASRDELELRVRERTLELARANEALRFDELRLESLFNLSQMVDASTRHIAEYVLEQQIKLTRSKDGAIGLLSPDESVFTLYADSADVGGGVIDRPIDLSIERIGMIGEAVKQRKPIVINEGFCHLREEVCLEGPVCFNRSMLIPVFDGDQIVAIAFLANKEEDYDASDVRQVTLLMDGMWKLIQREQAERALREAESLAAMGRALSAVAHDIKTPLVAIGGFTRIVNEHLEKGSPDRAKLDIVVGEVARLEQMIHQMLDFSRPLELNLSTEDLNRVIHESLVMIDAEAVKRRVRLDRNLAAAPALPFDAMRMKQVLINLILNAIQASPADSTVAISTRLKGERVIIDITDCGCGIPVEKRKEIFLPFFSTKKEGTGLGLPIVKKIVQAHHGSIQILDNPKKGITFRVILPVRPSKEVPEQLHIAG